MFFHHLPTSLQCLQSNLTILHHHAMNVFEASIDCEPKQHEVHAEHMDKKASQAGNSEAKSIRIRGHPFRPAACLAGRRSAARAQVRLARPGPEAGAADQPPALSLPVTRLDGASELNKKLLLKMKAMTLDMSWPYWIFRLSEISKYWKCQSTVQKNVCNGDGYVSDGYVAIRRGSPG